MKPLSSKEFFDQLKTNTLKPAFILKGIVKKSDKDSEVLFTKKGNFMNWIKIPSSIIESVFVLKTFFKEDKTFAIVKLLLKTPETEEGKILLELLSLYKKDEDQKCTHEGHGYCGMHDNFCGMKQGNFCSHCGCHHGHGTEHFGDSHLDCEKK